MKLKFWGAAQTVTGSMHLLEFESGRKVLLDCGIYQGNEGFADEYNRSFPCEPSEIDTVILSHAHIDHCGNLPQLVKAGFRGKIYCTHATYDLCTLLLSDSGRIQEKDAEYHNKKRKRKNLPPVEPIYTSKDVPACLKRFVTISYDTWQSINPELSLLFLDAGHMLGSASITLKIKDNGNEFTLGFTGDVGRPEQPILRDPVPMPEVDYLISESTYGGKDHPPLHDASEDLLKVIQDTCVKNRGRVIIPAFSVGRTQNIVYSLDQLEHAGRMPKVQVYVDSPLAVNSTAVFEMHPECYDMDLLTYMEKDPNPFGWGRLKYTRSVEDSKAINNNPNPCVIISASGMMTAGRILHHLKNNIEDPRNTILVVGYCAKNTLGSRIVNGDKKIRIFGEPYHVRAKIKRLNSFSGHAGQNELSQFISNSQNPKKLKKLFLVHGEADRAAKFKDHLNENGYDQVVIPARGESFVLD